MTKNSRGHKVANGILPGCRSLAIEEGVMSQNRQCPENTVPFLLSLGPYPFSKYVRSHHLGEK